MDKCEKKGYELVEDTDCEIWNILEIIRLSLNSMIEIDQIMNFELPIEEIEEKLKLCNNIDTEEKEKLRDLLINSKEVFYKKPGCLNAYEHEIQVIDDTPFYAKTYPIPQTYLSLVEKEINDMHRDGIIRPSNSSFINPTVIAKTRDGVIRVCVDTRQINSRILPNYNTQLGIDEILMR